MILIKKDENMKKAIIFDLDGTLVNTAKGIVEALSITIEELSGKSIDNEDIRKTIGIPLLQAIALLMDKSETDPIVLEAKEKYLNKFKKIVLPKSKELIFSGVTETLSTLKEQGFLLSVATNKLHKSALELLAATDLLFYFDHVFGVDSVENAKPSPDMCLLAMQKMGSLPENTLMIGDTTHDIKAARNANIKTIAVTYGIHNKETLEKEQPYKIINSFSDILK